MATTRAAKQDPDPQRRQTPGVAVCRAPHRSVSQASPAGMLQVPQHFRGALPFALPGLEVLADWLATWPAYLHGYTRH